MKTFTFLFLALGLVAAGCQQISVSPVGSAQRTVSGVVNLKPDILFPVDTEVLVRVIDTTALERAGTTAANDLPTMDRGRTPKTDRVLGEHAIKAPPGKPAPFRIEFEADDALMQRGLILDVRISYYNRVQFRTISAHMITLSSLRQPQEVWVEAAR
jgi:uncharacterized lipoprotein YbaY